MHRKQALMLAAVALGTFMAALNASVVNIAAPVIGQAFAADMSAVEWVITAYLLVISCVLLFFGRLADIHGQKKVYVAGFAVFTAGSVLCGLSGGIGALIGMRVVQALGAGMMYATSAAIIAAGIPAALRGRAFGVNAVAVAVALSAGPVLGGALTSAFGWQSLFFINLPVGIAGLWMAVRFVPPDAKRPPVPMDIPGSVMLSGALLLLLLALNQTGSGRSPGLLWLLLAGGAALTAGFIAHQKRVRSPILALSLFRSRVFSASLAAAVLCYMAQYIMVFLTPFYLQTVRLFTPAMAGLLYMPMPLATLAVAPFAGMFADRYDTRLLTSAGMGVMAAGLLLLSRLDADTPLWAIAVSMAVTGLGSGLFQTPNNTALMGGAPPEHRGVASGLLAAARNVGMVFGVALSGALFSLFAGRATGSLALTEGDPAVFAYALRFSFFIAAGVALGAMAASLVKGRVRMPHAAKKS
jgi:EmrB/QacA subfamily drug resistance transporter